LAAAYLALVVVFIVLAFDFEGAIREPWVWYLVVATLPGSLVAWFGMWALIHGANLGCFALFFFGCGVLNVFLVHRITHR